MFHSGEPLTIRMRLRAPLAIDDFVFGIGIFNAEGVCCYGTNTSLEELKAERMFGDAEATFTIDSLDLVEGTYKLDVAVHKRRRLSVRLSPAAVHLPREVADQGRRHLPAAPPLALLRQASSSSGPARQPNEGRPRRARTAALVGRGRRR